MRKCLAARVAIVLVIVIALSLYPRSVEAGTWGVGDGGWAYSVGQVCRNGVSFSLAKIDQDTIYLEAKVGTSIIARNKKLTLSNQPINLEPDPTQDREGSGWFPFSHFFAVPWSPLSPSSKVQLEFGHYDAQDNWVFDWEPLLPGRVPITYVVADCYLSDLSISMTANPDPVALGGTLNYTLNVNNSSPSGLVTETARDSFPTEFAFITIPDNDRTHPISNTIDVAGLTGSVTGITVTLTGLSHNFPDDLDIFLEAPNGQQRDLMSDAGGGFSIPEPGVDLVFDDTAPTTIPDNAQITSGTYKPYDWPNTVTGLAAPEASVPNALAGLYSTAPNGTWKLWLADDAAGNTGSLDDWALSITTTTPAATVVDTLPSGTTFVSASGTGWSCSRVNLRVTCSRSSLGHGAAPPITISVRAPKAIRSLTNTAKVSGSSPDPELRNNTASTTTLVLRMVYLPVVRK